MSRIWIGTNLINFSKVTHISFRQDARTGVNGRRETVYYVTVNFEKENLTKTNVESRVFGGQYIGEDMKEMKDDETKHTYEGKTLTYIISREEYLSLREQM